MTRKGVTGVWNKNPSVCVDVDASGFLGGAVTTSACGAVTLILLLAAQCELQNTSITEKDRMIR
jgi:hypothetical protein